MRGAEAFEGCRNLPKEKEGTVNPELDGKDHINVYSKGRTEVGRLLSNFAHTPFEHPTDGRFESVEGYWYWLLSKHEDRDRLRRLHGFLAKQVGREQRAPDDPQHTDQAFREKIYYAFEAKLKGNPELARMLKDSTLPFKHYYAYEKRIVTLPQHDWVLVYWDRLRYDLQNEDQK